MDPDNGRIYASVEDAKLSGVENPIPVEVEETEEGFVVQGPDMLGKMILAINGTHRRSELYAGTVPYKEVAKRRTRNKMARQTRRNQRRGKR